MRCYIHSPRYPWIGGWVEPRSRSGWFGKQNISFFSLPGIKLRISQPVTQSLNKLRYPGYKILELCTIRMRFSPTCWFGIDPVSVHCCISDSCSDCILPNRAGCNVFIFLQWVSVVNTVLVSEIFLVPARVCVCVCINTSAEHFLLRKTESKHKVPT